MQIPEPKLSEREIARAWTQITGKLWRKNLNRMKVGSNSATFLYLYPGDQMAANRPVASALTVSEKAKYKGKPNVRCTIKNKYSLVNSGGMKNLVCSLLVLAVLIGCKKNDHTGDHVNP